MVTVIPPPKTQKPFNVPRRFGSNGNGNHGNGKKNGGGGGGSNSDGGDDSSRKDRDDNRDSSPERFRVGMMVALMSIMMMFSALIITYIVRAGLSGDWNALRMPPTIWIGTVALVASSLTLEAARRALGKHSIIRYQRMLAATTALGIIFLVLQMVVWQQLNAQGIYLATNPHSSFFYLLTGAHAVHLLGGIVALAVLTWRAWEIKSVERDERRRRHRAAAAGTVALYWHFMDALWLVLFVVLALG